MPLRAPSGSRSSSSSRLQRQPMQQWKPVQQPPQQQRRHRGSVSPLCAPASNRRSTRQPSSRRLPVRHIQSSVRRRSRVGRHSRVACHQRLQLHVSATERWPLLHHPRCLATDTAARPGVTRRVSVHGWSSAAPPHRSQRLPTDTVSQPDNRTAALCPRTLTSTARRNSPG